MLLILIIVTVLFMYFLIAKRTDWILTIFFVLFISILILLYNLSYIEYEHSGYVITIKKKRLFMKKGFVKPILEFPAILLKEVHIEKNTLYLKVSSSSIWKKKPRQFRIPLKGFTEEQCTKIESSLLKEINS